jgi:hypothetical protein
LNGPNEALKIIPCGSVVKQKVESYPLTAILKIITSESCLLAMEAALEVTRQNVSVES